MNDGRYVVDRIEGKYAVMARDDGATVDVPLDELPRDLREGAVLLVPLSRDGAPNWASAMRDHEEEERRLEEAKGILEELKKRDEGGDVVL